MYTANDFLYYILRILFTAYIADCFQHCFNVLHTIFHILNMIVNSIVLHTYSAYSAPTLCGMHHIVFTLFYIDFHILLHIILYIMPKAPSAWRPPLHDAESLCFTIPE